MASPFSIVSCSLSKEVPKVVIVVALKEQLLFLLFSSLVWIIGKSYLARWYCVEIDSSVQAGSRPLLSLINTPTDWIDGWVRGWDDEPLANICRMLPQPLLLLICSWIHILRRHEQCPLWGDLQSNFISHWLTLPLSTSCSVVVVVGVYAIPSPFSDN